MKRNININKKVSKNTVIIFISVTIIIFAVILNFVINDARNLTFIEKTIKDGALFINKIFAFPLNIINNDNEIKKIEESIKKQSENEINNLKKELNELKNNLEINNLLSDYDKINATVINRNLGYFYNTITIDKGSKDKIKKDMAVISSQGLIGKVIKTTRYNSTVKLLTSDDSYNKVSVQIKVNEKYLYGILSSFDKENGYYIVEGVSDTKDIKAGDLVSTTGMGDIFPSGILIGEVVSKDLDNFEISAIIKVKPSININNFNYVTVLRRNQ